MSKPRNPRITWAALVAALLVILAALGWLVPRSAGLGSGSGAQAGAPSRASSTAPLRLVGFGDSVLAGAGCSCKDYLTQTADLLHDASGRRVTTTNNGANGETAAELLQDLRSDDKAIAQVAQADVIVLTVGANDLQPSLDSWSGAGCGADCYQPEIAAMTDRLASVLAIVDHAKKPRAAVLVTDYWNVYLDGDVGQHTYGAGYLSWSDRVTRAANTAICQAAENADATCVDLYRPFKADGDRDPTGLLADDGDHANARGTATISQVVASAIERVLSITPRR